MTKHELSPESLSQVRAMPKVDLHRHLEGSLRIASMLDIIQEYQLELPSSEQQLRSLVQMVPGDARTPQVFLSKFQIIRQFFRSREVIQRLVNETVEDAAQDGVALLELRFTPAALYQASGLTIEEVIDCVVQQSGQSAEAHGLTLGLIISINRHEPLELAEQVIGAAANWLGDGILGVDLAGDEVGHSAERFAPLFNQAKERGFKVTIHAGEWGGPEHVAHAIHSMGANRIGHGVRTIQDPTVVQLARTAAVGFELSLSSNLWTGVFKNDDTYPLLDMMEAGLRIALTTDDPSIFATTLSLEHELTIKRLGVSIETLKGLTLQALQLSFVGDQEKKRLESIFSEHFWGGKA